MVARHARIEILHNSPEIGSRQPPSCAGDRRSPLQVSFTAEMNRRADDIRPYVTPCAASKNAPEFGSVFHWICFYFKLSARCRNVTMWPRVQFAIVPKLPSPMPLVMPFSAAQSTGSVNHSPAGTSLNGIAVELTAG